MKNATKYIPTINKPLFVEVSEEKNEYGEGEVIIRAQDFTGTISSTNPKKWKYTPHVAVVNFGHNEAERKTIADHLVMKCNAHDKLVENLSNMVFNFGAHSKSVMQKKAIEYARKILNEVK